MKLTYLPNELLQLITQNLSRQSVSRLCLTCTQGYYLFLPTLYKHIELGHRTHIKQLEQGLIRNSYLKETVKEHTQILTLKCRQGGNGHFLIISLFQQLPNIKQIHFRDFLSLSVTRVKQVLQFLPHLTSLDFQYCGLIIDQDDMIAAEAKKESVLYNLTELNLVWTDFSADAVRQLLTMTPNLTRVLLGANHNRKRLANDAALQVLTQTCHHIKDITISLQQVKEASICRMITRYGSQLEHLSIRCEGNETIRTISQYTTKLQGLVIRCSNYSVGNNFMHILEQCKALTHLEMVSWPLQDVPSVVLDQLRFKSPCSISPPSSAYIEGIKRTVALDRQDLQEIRRLCLYSTTQN